MLFNGPATLRIAHSLGISTSIQYMILWFHPTQPPNGISIGSAVFACLTITNVTNRVT